MRADGNLDPLLAIGDGGAATYCVEPTWMKLTQSIMVLLQVDCPGSWQAAMKARIASPVTSFAAIERMNAG